MAELTGATAHTIEVLLRDTLAADGDELLGIGVYPRSPKTTEIGQRSIKVVRDEWVVEVGVRGRDDGMEHTFRTIIDSAGEVIDNYEEH